MAENNLFFVFGFLKDFSNTIILSIVQKWTWSLLGWSWALGKWGPLSSHMILKIMVFCWLVWIRPFIKKKNTKISMRKIIACNIFLSFVDFNVLYKFLVFFGVPCPCFLLSPLGLAFSRHLKIHSLYFLLLAFCNDLVVLMRVNCSLGNLDPILFWPCFFAKELAYCLLFYFEFYCISVSLWSYFGIAFFGSAIRGYCSTFGGYERILLSSWKRSVIWLPDFVAFLPNLTRTSG